MAIKTFLVPVELGNHLAPTLETALLMAKSCDGHVAGIGLGISYVVVGPMGGMVVTTQEIDEQTPVEDLRKAFADHMNGAGVPRAETPGPGLGWNWSGEGVITDAELGSVSRIYDAAIIGRPDPDLNGPRIATVENILFEGGRPVLIAPPKPLPQIGKSILIAWNCSTESARAVSFAMPLIETADKVTVLTVEGGTVPGPSGEELCNTLKAHGVPAECKSMAASAGSVGETILSEAASQGSDLIVKGAYTHSRLRQMIFGGPTSHLLYHAEVPVFMAC